MSKYPLRHSRTEMFNKLLQTVRDLIMIKSGPWSILTAYREWKAADPKLTAAMVRAGRTPNERRQLKLALCYLRTGILERREYFN